MNGALNGADGRIVEFFRKSQLDNQTLSRIWALADVNEDGFLNLSEFVVAMHLILLHIKVLFFKQIYKLLKKCFKKLNTQR